MRQVTATEKYRAVNEGKLAKGAFVRDMRMAHPSIISQWNSYDDTVQILKNKGFISEKSNVDSYDSRFELNISSDSIDRGVRYELQAKGIDPVNAKEEEFNGVKSKVIKNLKKDPLHYILLVSGESNKVNKNDKPKEVKRGAADKDTFNDLKKATLKEGYTEEQINAAIQRLKEKKNLANEASQEESVADYIIKHYTNPKTGKSLVDDEIVSDFFKTHPEWEQQADGTEEGMKDLLHNFGEYLDANYEGASDMREEVVKSHPDEIEDATFPVAEAFKKVGIDMSKDVHVHYTDGGPPGLGAGQLKDLGTQSPEKVIKMLEAKRLKEIEQYKEDSKDAGYEMEFPVMYEYFYYGGEKFMPKTEDGVKEFKLTYGVFEGETYDIFQESSNMGEEEKRELPKSIADKERDQIEKDAKKAKGMIKEKLTEVEAIQVGIDKGYSNEQIAAAISKLKGNQVTEEKEGKYSWEYDDQGYGALESFFDHVLHQVGPDISLEDAKELIGSKGKGGDDTKAFDQAVITQMQNTNEDEDDVKSTQNMIQAYEEKYNEPFSTNLIKHLDDLVYEKKGKDHDGDGDIDKDDYMAAKDKAIKKAMGKDEVVRESLKNIISKVLEEQTINEAATNHLAGLADTYGDFEGFKQSIIQLQDIVTDIESYYDKTRNKIQKVYDSIADIRNDEGLKVGAFLAPSIEAAFNKDLRPVSKAGFTKGLETPKVKVMKKDDLNAGSMYEEEPKQSVFTPINEGFTVVGPDKEKNAKELADIAKKLGLTSQIHRSPSGNISDIDIKTADGKNIPHSEIPQEFLDAHERQMDNAPDEGSTIKPGKKLKKLTKGGITYEVGEEDPEDEGTITSIEKYLNGYFISGTVYGDDDGDEYEREGYGYAIDLDGEEMDEEDLKGRF